MTCYFLIDDFNCAGTDSNRCFKALKVRLDSPETPEEEQKLFDDCAAKISQKDSFLGSHAQALIRQKREVTGTNGTIEIFHDYVPKINFSQWQSFIKDNTEQINAFKLSRYLKERWGLLSDAEKLESMDNAEKIITLVETTFSRQRKLLSRALMPITGEIKDLRRETYEDRIKEKIKTLVTAKEWEELNTHIAGLDTAGFSFALIERLNKAQQKAEEGVLWNRRREILDRLLEDSARLEPDIFYQGYSDVKADLHDLVDRQSEMAGKDAVADVRQRLDIMFANILEQEKQWDTHAQNKLLSMKQWKDEFPLLYHEPTDEWNAYTAELEDLLTGSFANEFLDVFKTAETIGDISRITGQIIAGSEMLGLKNQVEDFIADGQDESIFELHQQVEQWIQFDYSLERIFNAADPFTMTITLPSPPEDFNRVSGVVRSAGVFGKIRKKYRAAQEVMEVVGTSTELLKNLVNSMINEAKNILYNKPVLKFEGFEGQFKAVRKKTSQTAKKHDVHYRFDVLNSLKASCDVIQRLLFAAKKTQPRQADKELLARGGFLKSIKDALDTGESLTHDLKQLKAGAKSGQAQDPTAFQNEFFKLITAYHPKQFLFTRSKAKEITALYQNLMDAIHSGIDSYIKPLKEQLNFPFPLLERGTLEPLHEKTQALLEQMQTIEENYPGFEELVETYRDELKQWEYIMELHEAVRREAFDLAGEIVEKQIYDPDIRYPAQILVYYYRYLFKVPWEKDLWVNFFNRFSLDSLKRNEYGYRVLLKHYQKEARKHFGQFSLQAVEIHYKVFNAFFDSDNLLPYLSYLCPHGDTGEFLKAIKQHSQQSEFFTAVIIILEKSGEWKKYMELYHQAPEKYKRYFDNPVQKVKDALEEQYQLLLESFKNGAMNRPALETYFDKIPEGEECKEFIRRGKRMRDLFESLKDISTSFKRLESEDIWIQDDFYRKLYQNLERLTDQFTGDDYASIRESEKWPARLATLREIYDLGRELIEEMNKLVHTDSQFKVKAEVAYSDAFQKQVKELLDTWNRFREEIAQMKGNEVFKDSFQHYHMDRFNKLHKKMSLHYLLEETDRMPPKTLDAFFTLWEEITENHQRFLELYKKKKDSLRCGDLKDRKIEVLDEFIRLTLDRLNQQAGLQK